jgi:hypothetical protein
VGFFGDVNKLRQMGEEQQQSFDVKARMANAQARMTQATQAFAASTPAVVDPASEARRVDATATISSARHTGMVINFDVMVEVGLLIMLPNGVPLPVTTTILVPQLSLARLQPGSQVAVTVDPSNPASVRMDWNRF